MQSKDFLSLNVGGVMSLFVRSSRVIRIEYWIHCVIRFSIISFLALYLINDFALSNIHTAWILSTVAIFPKMVRVLISKYLDRVSPKSVLIFSTVLSSGFLFCVAYAEHWLWVTLFFVGIETCYNINSLQVRSLVANETKDAFKGFAQLSVLMNVAACMGPLVSSWAMAYKVTPVLFLVEAVVMAVMGFVLWKMLPLIRSSGSTQQSDRYQGRVSISGKLKYFGDVKTGCLVLLVSGLYAQLNALFPLYIGEYFGVIFVGGVYSINAVVVIFLTMPIVFISSIYLEKFASKIKMALVLFFIAFSMLCFQVRSVELVFFSVFIFSVAEILSLPSLLALATQRVPKAQVSSTLAVNSLVSSIGEGGGMFIGIFLATLSIGNISVGFAFFALLSLLGLVYFSFSGLSSNPHLK